MTDGADGGADNGPSPGHGPYGARTRWAWWAAALFTGAVLIVAMAMAQFTMLGLAEVDVRSVHWQVLSALAVSQMVSIGLIWWAAGWYGDDRALHLALGPPAQGVTAYVRAYLLMALVFGALSLVLWLIDPKRVIGDLTLYSDLVRSNAWWLAVLVIVLGAPMMEEIMFRGFLFPALARGPFGRVGAAVATAAAWSALHAGYSFMGLLEVFAVGLYFAWLLVWSGSLRVPMFCHAAYNASALAVLLLVDKPAPIAG